MNADLTLTPFPVIAVVASAGGLHALGVLLAALPAGFPGAVVIVQHLSPDRPSLMAALLGRQTPLPVKQAAQGDLLAPGRVFLAPPGHHLLTQAGGRLSLTQTEKVQHVRPSGDVLFLSVAGSFGPRAIAVVLTGSLGDGADGLRAIKAAGGVTVAQDEGSSESYSMPRTAMETGCVDHILPLDAIAPLLVSLVAAPR